jgi:hypothetical protein
LLDHRRFGFTVFPYLLALRGGPEKVPDPFSSFSSFSSLFVADWDHFAGAGKMMVRIVTGFFTRSYSSLYGILKTPPLVIS